MRLGCCLICCLGCRQLVQQPPSLQNLALLRPRGRPDCPPHEALSGAVNLADGVSSATLACRRLGQHPPNLQKLFPAQAKRVRRAPERYSVDEAPQHSKGHNEEQPRPAQHSEAALLPRSHSGDWQTASIFRCSATRSTSPDQEGSGIGEHVTTGKCRNAWADSDTYKEELALTRFLHSSQKS